MYRPVILIVFAVAALADDEMRQCGKLVRSDTLSCCSKFPISPPTFGDDLKECLSMPFTPRSCEREECFAKKRGYYVSGGGLDLEKFGQVLEKDFEKSPDILTKFKDSCFKGVSQYGTPDMCELMKMRHCLQIQLLKQCTEWKDEGECNGVQELIEECAKKFS